MMLQTYDQSEIVIKKHQIYDRIENNLALKKLLLSQYNFCLSTNELWMIFDNLESILLEDLWSGLLFITQT